jgi:hypothetical protein
LAAPWRAFSWIDRFLLFYPQPALFASRPASTMPASLAAYHYFSPQTAGCNSSRRKLTASAAGRRCAGSQRLAPPRCRRRQQQRRAAALFGFGNKPAAAEPAAPPQDGPIIIPYTPVSKTKDYSLRLFNAYPVAEVRLGCAPPAKG